VYLLILIVFGGNFQIRIIYFSVHPKTAVPCQGSKMLLGVGVTHSRHLFWARVLHVARCRLQADVDVVVVSHLICNF